MTELINTEVKDDSLIILTRDELNEMQIQTLQRELNKSETEKLNLQISNIELIKENMLLKSARFENEIHALKSNLMNISQSSRTLKKKYAALIVELTDKYSLPSRWGINPDTGEVVYDD